MTKESTIISLPKEVAEIYEIVKKLEEEYKEYERKFTPDGHLVGSLGEVIAAKHFNLTLEKSSNKGFDATDGDDRKVEIKTTGIRKSPSIVLSGSSERLIVLKIINPQQAEVVYDVCGVKAYEKASELKKGKKISISKLKKIAE